jgi:BirA family biotin operon repressor/biotin-[acetyl-CoA-carboxylase] ligase
MTASTSAEPACLNIAVLERLKSAGGDYVPLSELGPNLGQVRDHLAALIDFGFAIEQHPYRGAALSAPATRLCPDQIEYGLNTRLIGRRVAVWNRVESTNDLALRAGASRSNEGLVVLAEEQTAGRGRRGSAWTAPPYSSILMSIVVFPPSHLSPGGSETALGCGLLTALGAIAAAEVVSDWTGHHATIKWPNDVLLGGRKIAGILVERARSRKMAPSSVSASTEPLWSAVIGIGLNVNLGPGGFPAELAARATSIQIERGGTPADRSELARDLIRRLDYWYSMSYSHGADVLNPSWRARSEILGKVVRVVSTSASITARLVDLDVRLGVTLEPTNGRDDSAADRADTRVLRVPLGEIRALEAAAHDESR